MRQRRNRVLKMNDDTPALLSWLAEKEMKAHINAAKHQGFTKGLEYSAEEKAVIKDKATLALVIPEPKEQIGVNVVVVKR